MDFNCKHYLSRVDNGRLYITFEVTEDIQKQNALESIPKPIKDEKPLLTVSVDRFRDKRSKEANRYAWRLIGKLSKITGIHKDEIYKKNVYDSGFYVESEIPYESLKDFKEYWESCGKGWFVDVIDSGRGGKVLIHSYKGSSKFNSLQMYRFIQLIKEDCRQYNIQTLTDKEIKRLSEQWESK